MSDLDRSELLSSWTALKGFSPPAGLPSVRMRRDLDYAEQVAADLRLVRIERQVLKRLKQVGRESTNRSAAIAPGTRFFREWGGKTHEVTVTDLGFVYGGKTFRSLSAIARFITGTPWSGPKFFGVS